MKHLDKHNILSKLQHGYRNKCSTETQLLKVIDLFAKGLNNHKQIDCISLDFSRAFDVVPHQRLLLKMQYYGIRKILPWIQNFLTSRKQAVVIEGVKSRYVSVISGLPQGTVLAGLLFFIFINDLPESVLQSFTGIFCDDTLLAKEISDINDAEQLQDDLNHVFEWSKLWGMKFNAEKCIQMTVTNKRKYVNYQYYLNEDILERKNKIKYLGITIDNKLSFSEHIQDKCKKATTVLNMLKRNLYFAPKIVKEKAYVACVLPIIEYGSSSWNPTSKKQQNSLEMVQHNAAKFVANRYPKKGKYEEFSINKVISSLEWRTLEERRNHARLVMAYKIINGKVILEPNSLPKSTIKQPSRKCKGIKFPEFQLIEPFSQLDNVTSTFFYSTPKIWNKTVTESLAKSPSIEAFKNNLKKL